jgi:hypothetical protein
MNNKALIVTGLILFLIIILFPFWYMRGKAVPFPDPVLTPKAQAAQACVRSTDYMRSEHMKLLDLWRESVVREGKRIYVNPQGKEFTMSLSNTCLDCHSNKAEFCDRCHNYASVRPYCWNCHIENPKEKA